MAKPSHALRQHHDIDPPRIDRLSFRPAWRIRSRLDALLTEGHITPAQWQAACDYRDTHAIACGSLRTPLPFLVRTGPLSRDARMIASLDAVTRLRIVDTSIGPLASALIEACVLDDRPWREIARTLDVNHETARDWTISAIKALADVWTPAKPSPA